MRIESSVTSSFMWGQTVLTSKSWGKIGSQSCERGHPTGVTARFHACCTLGKRTRTLADGRCSVRIFAGPLWFGGGQGRAER
jgi:hypothetical protein